MGQADKSSGSFMTVKWTFLVRSAGFEPATF